MAAWFWWNRTARSPTAAGYSEDYFEDYFEDFDMLIVFGGLPGTGKTSLARALAKRLDGVYLRIDSMEQAIRSSGALQDQVADAGYRAGCAVAADNLRLGRTVIADAVNPVAAARQAWRDIAGQTDAAILEVEVVCSDTKEHRRRVETRQPDIEGLRQPTWADVMARTYEPWDRDRIVIDTAKADLEKSINELFSKMRDSS